MRSVNKNIRKQLIKVVLSTTVLACSLAGLGQDLHLSQYEASPQHFNPAMTGMFEGAYRVNVHYRSQWRSIVSPFTTSSFSFDMPIEGSDFKVGGFVLNNRAGSGKYNALNAIVSGSYDYRFKDHHHLVGGLQLGLIHKSVDVQKLYFGDQFSERNGGYFDRTLNSNETFSNTAFSVFDLNVGGMYFYSNDESKVNPFVGASVFHVHEPKESFFNSQNNRLPRRYLTQAGVKVSFSEEFQLGFQLLGMRQENANELTSSLMGYYYLKESDVYLLLGTTYRNKDAAIIHTGIKYKEFIYRFSYDVNTSSLRPLTNGRGGFEMSVVYIFKKLDPNPVTVCPRI